MGERRRDRSLESTVVDSWAEMKVEEGSMLELAEKDQQAYTKDVTSKLARYRKTSERMGREMRNASIVAAALFLSLAAGGAERTGMFKLAQRSTESGAGLKPTAKMVETIDSTIPSPQREAVPDLGVEEEYFDGDFNTELKALEALTVQSDEATPIEITEFPDIDSDLK